MNRQLESITKVKLGPYVIRVWRTESDLSKVDNNDIHKLGRGAGASEFPPDYDIAEAFAKLPRVAAVEVVDALGRGVLIYPDWN